MRTQTVTEVLPLNYARTDTFEPFQGLDWLWRFSTRALWPPGHPITEVCLLLFRFQETPAAA